MGVKDILQKQQKKIVGFDIVESCYKRSVGNNVGFKKKFVHRDEKEIERMSWSLVIVNKKVK